MESYHVDGGKTERGGGEGGGKGKFPCQVSNLMSKVLIAKKGGKGFLLTGARGPNEKKIND